MFSPLTPLSHRNHCCCAITFISRRKNTKALGTQSCLTLCNPMDCSPPGFSVLGILQARILEWVAIPFSRESFWPRDQTRVSCIGRQILYCWATWEVIFPYLPLWTNQRNICWANEWAIKTGLLNPSIINILSWMILQYGRLSCASQASTH